MASVGSSVDLAFLDDIRPRCNISAPPDGPATIDSLIRWEDARLQKLTSFVGESAADGIRAAIQKITVVFKPKPDQRKPEDKPLYFYHATAFAFGRKYLLTAAHNFSLEGVDDLAGGVRFVEAFIPSMDNDEERDVLLRVVRADSDADLAILGAKKATFHRLLLRDISQQAYARSYTIELHNIRSIAVHEGRVLPSTSSSDGQSNAPAKLGFSGGPILDRRGFVDGLVTTVRAGDALSRVGYNKCEKIWDFLTIHSNGRSTEQICRYWDMKGIVRISSGSPVMKLIEPTEEELRGEERDLTCACKGAVAPEGGLDVSLSEKFKALNDETYTKTGILPPIAAEGKRYDAS